MMIRIPRTDHAVVKQLRVALGDPAPLDLAHSRARVAKWLAGEGALIRWGEMRMPLAGVYAPVGGQGG